MEIRAYPQLGSNGFFGPFDTDASGAGADGYGGTIGSAASMKTPKMACTGKSRMKNENRTQQELIDEIVELRKRNEQLEQSGKSAQERSEFLLALLDSISGFITAWDTTGILLFANQTFVNQSGFRREDVIGKPSLDLYPPQEIARIVKVIC